MLKVKIENIEFNSPIIAASGTFGYGYEFGDFVDLKNVNLFQKGVILQLNILKEEIKLIDDVESLLYGKTYGKASE